MSSSGGNDNRTSSDNRMSRTGRNSRVLSVAYSSNGLGKVLGVANRVGGSSSVVGVLTSTEVALGRALASRARVKARPTNESGL